MWNISQCLKLKATVGMSDLDYVTLSFAARVFISLRLVYIKCHKMYVPYPVDDLSQTNGRSLLQRQTHSALLRWPPTPAKNTHNKNKKTKRKTKYILINS